jgi:tetratricopeptide (TPR) repeat protein
MNLQKIVKIFFSIIALAFSTSFPQNQSDLLKTEALSQMEQGRYGEAIDLLNRYISANPQQAEGYNLRGLCNERRAQYEYAVYDFRSARKLDLNNSEIAENLKRTTEAWYALLYNKIEGHNREIAINPNKPINYLEIGKSFKNLGEWLTAEAWYDKYLEREEASSDEIIRYTEILAKNNHIGKGEPILKKYVEKYPRDHRLWSRYGYFTLWLGKKQTAIDAFEKALEIRPFFKEAMDGLDQARGKGYIYTVNDTSQRFTGRDFTPQKRAEYAIDRYYRILKNNPADNAARKLLIKELMKVNRFEEAYNELQILGRTESNTGEFKELEKELLSKRKEFYSKRILELEEKFNSSPGDKNTALMLAQYYSINGETEKAIDVLERYLVFKPNDFEARFLLSQYASWNRDNRKAAANLDYLLQFGPDSLKYKVLRAQIAVWMNEDLELAEKLLKEILASDRENIFALITLSMLNFQRQNYSEAERYAVLAMEIDPGNPDVQRLFYMLEIQQKKDEEGALLALLDRARTNAFNGNCNEAIKFYLDFISQAGSTKEIYMELANAYICAEQHRNAIKIYDDLLTDDYDYEIDKQRAKVYFWSSDSAKALVELIRLSSANPNDPEAKLLLGDAYLRMQQYSNARRVYNELLAQSPSSLIIKQRLGYLPVTGFASFGEALEQFPLYTLVSPQGIYFSDNFSFNYTYQGLAAEFGVTDFLAIGGSAFRGRISSDSVQTALNLFMVRGQLLLTFSEIFSARGSIGQTRFSNDFRRNIYEVSVTAAKENLYTVTASFLSMDAAQLLYSANLVDTRLKANNVNFTGRYTKPNGLILAGNYSYFALEDDNEGNNFTFRLGKQFLSDITAGYEYYYSNYKTISPLYFSPQNYESHSIWGDLNLYNDESTEIIIGGKVGIIPSIHFIVRELYGEARFNLLDNLILLGRVSAAGTMRDNFNYNSTSFYAALFWTF